MSGAGAEQQQGRSWRRLFLTGLYAQEICSQHLEEETSDVSLREDDKNTKWSAGRAGAVLGTLKDQRDPRWCVFIAIVTQIPTLKPGEAAQVHAEAQWYWGPGLYHFMLKFCIFVQLAA